MSNVPVPLLIDTDMGVDDAIAIGLAYSTPQLEVTAIVSVGGNVGLEQATSNIGRLLGGLGVANWPAIGRGLDQEDTKLERAHHVFASDGLGGALLEEPSPWKREPASFEQVYQEVGAKYPKQLVLIAIGPLTNLAALLTKKPALLTQAARIIVMGGAVWCPGNTTPHAEFNFYRDPAAAAKVLQSGLPITVVPLDVTRQVAMDVAHAAHLVRSGSRVAELLARMIQFPLENHHEAGEGRFLVHDALTVGLLLWPELFMQARMGLDIATNGPQAGKSKPIMPKDKSRQVSVVISVNAPDFLDNMIELLSHEKFVV